MLVTHAYRLTAILGPVFLLCIEGGAFLTPPIGGGGGILGFISVD